MKYIKFGLLFFGILIAVLAALIFIKPLFEGAKTAYDFTAVTTTGEQITLSTLYAEKGTVLLFFETEQEQSVALLERIIQRAAGKLHIVAVSAETKDAAEQLACLPADVQAQCLIIQQSADILALYNIGTAPITHFIDQGGVVRESYVYKISDKSLQKALNTITD